MNSTRRAALAAALTLTALTLTAFSARPAGAQELIQNGGFETGTLANWTTQDQAGSNGTFQAESGTTLATSDPLGIRPTVGPASGTYYAVTDEGGSGSHALLQAFTVTGSVSSVRLTFDMFVDNYAGGAATPATLDDTTPYPNQQARVDLLSGNAGAFDLGTGVLANFYDGADLAADPLRDNPHPYTHYSFDLTPYVVSGGTYQLRFAAVNNQDTLYQGVDNVSIHETPAAVPEASTTVSFGLLLALGLGGVVIAARRKKAVAS